MNINEDQVLERAAEIVAERVLEGMLGDPAELVRFPAADAARMAGIRQKDLAAKCPVIRDGHRSLFVTLADYRRAFIPQHATHE